MRIPIALVLLVAACSDDNPMFATVDAAPPDSAAPMPDGSEPQMVPFSYHPSWSGVTAVTVVASTDWTQPLATLTNDGSGIFTGSAELPPGQYQYLFHVTGDEAAAMPASYARYALDPANPSFVACPQGAPTYNMNNANPCSQLTVPGGAPATLLHVRGRVLADGAAASGWLIVLERDETASHHFFVDRATTGADGRYDLLAAPGQYRVQVQYPTFLSQTDAQRDPMTLQALRRALSNAFMLQADIMLPDVEVAYHGYAQLSPRTGTATLPVDFTFTASTMTRVAVYGSTGATLRNIGDPWYASAYGSATSVSWTGMFNTMQAGQTTAQVGQLYDWGVWTRMGQWTGESMVFPLTLH